MRVKKHNVWVALFAACLFLLSLTFGGCKTREIIHQDKQQLEHQASSEVNINQNQRSETNHYGDSLKSNGFVPLPELQTDSPATDKPEVIRGESAGIKMKVTFTPSRDNKGKLTGHDVDIEATAKPVAKTNTESNTQASEKKTENTQVAIEQESSDTRKGWSPPAWVYFLIITILVVAVGLFYKRILNLLKLGK